MPDLDPNAPAVNSPDADHPIRFQSGDRWVWARTQKHADEIVSHDVPLRGLSEREAQSLYYAIESELDCERDNIADDPSHGADYRDDLEGLLVAIGNALDGLGIQPPQSYVLAPEGIPVNPPRPRS